jgi:hypothetical protein
MKRGLFGIKWTFDRKITVFLCCGASAGILLFWLIPHWQQEDRENEAKEVSHG